MRGEVLHYDETQGFGFIAGTDGKRYPFAREDLRRQTQLTKGDTVEFQPDGGHARNVFSVRTQFDGTQTTTPLASQPHHFGRVAADEPPASTGLWGYFMRGMTTNYANFRGRARRKEYWGFFLFSLITMALLTIAGLGVDATLGNLDTGNEFPVVTITMPILFWLVVIIPSVAMAIRRQHDIGLSGWFYLLILLPSIGSVILFVFALIPSQKYKNKWGPVPTGIKIPPPYAPAKQG